MAYANSGGKVAVEMTEKAIMNVEDTAELLDVTGEYVRRMAREHRIPSVKIGNRWRFVREQIVAWVAAGAPPQAQRLPIEEP